MKHPQPGRRPTATFLASDQHEMPRGLFGALATSLLRSCFIYRLSRHSVIYKPKM